MTLQSAFLDQAGHCARLGSPFMEQLLLELAQNWHDGLPLHQRLSAWQGDIGPAGASLPLRLAGGLHALVLTKQDEGLQNAYPPNRPKHLWPAVEAAMIRHAAFFESWMDNAPQTNEVRRSAALITVGQMLAARYALPIRLSELGASGGLNLMWDKFALTLPSTRFGPDDAAVSLTPDWEGPLPPTASPDVIERLGVDLNPLDPASDSDALTLLSYLWADQTDRLERTRAAIKLNTAKVHKGEAIDWLQTRLAAPKEGTLHLVYSTIAWQYFPKTAQARGAELMEAAGKDATAAAPLAWFSMENDGHTEGAALTLKLWPGDHTINLGRADFHGRWLKLSVASLP